MFTKEFDDVGGATVADAFEVFSMFQEIFPDDTGDRVSRRRKGTGAVDREINTQNITGLQSRLTQNN